MKFRYITAAMALTAALGLVGCGNKNTDDGNVANDIGRLFDGNNETTTDDRNDSAIGNIGRDVKNGVEDTLRDAGDGIENSLRGAGDTVKNGAADIANDGRIGSASNQSNGDAGIIGDSVTGNTVSDNATDGTVGNAGSNPTGAANS